MKKLFTSLILLVAGILVSNAQTLKIGNTSIDLTKNGTYTNVGTNNGTVTYDAASKRVTLKYVYLKDQTITGNNLSDATYYIRLQSSLNIVNSEGMCMRFDYSNVVFEGNGYTMVLDGSSYASSGRSTFDAEESSIAFWNIFMRVEAGGSNAFWGNSTKGSLSFIRAYGDISSTSGAAFKGFKSMSFDDGLIIDDNAKFVSGTGVTNSTDGSLLKTATLRPFLRIGGEIVRTALSSGSGTNWTWNQSTKTLTLTNAAVTTSTYQMAALENAGIDGLTLKIEGTCNLTQKSEAYSIVSSKSMTILGNGANSSNLTLEGKNGGIYSSISGGGTLTVKNINVNIQSYGRGIHGGSTTDLSINKSSLAVYGNSGSIVGLNSCTMTDCDVDATQSPNVCFRSSLNGFGTPNGLSYSAIYIGTLNTADKYNVYVLGHQVNALNKSCVAVDGLTSGQISFDSDAKKLTLDYVKLEAPSGDNNSGIRFYGGSDSDTYTVNLVGTNIVTTNGNACYIGRTTTFTGDGTGYFTSNAESGMSVYAPACVTLNSSNVIRFVGKKYGYYGSNDENEVLTFKKTTSDTHYYGFKGETKSVHNLRKLSMTGMDFTYGCYYNEDTHDVRINGGNSTNDWVGSYAVTTTYGITIADKEINNVNKVGVGSKYITKGGVMAVCYDPDTKTLTLAQVTVDNKGDAVNPVYNKTCDNLTINVTGNCELKSTSKNSSSTNIWKNTTIQGNGTLSLTGTNGNLHASNNAVVTLDDINMEIEGNAETTNTNGTLVVNLKTKDKQVKVDGSVYKWTAITLQNGTKVVEPAGAKLNADGTAVVTSNGGVASGVVFGDKTATAIDAVEVDRNADVRDIYDASGRQMDAARKGLNIIRMSDGTVRKVMVK